MLTNKRRNYAKSLSLAVAALVSTTAMAASVPPSRTVPGSIPTDTPPGMQLLADEKSGEVMDHSAAGAGIVVDHVDDAVGHGRGKHAAAPAAAFGIAYARVDGYWFGNGPISVPGYGTACNVMWVFDRSGDAVVRSALAEFINNFNALSNAIGRTCKYPVLSYYRDDANIGACQDAPYHLNGYSFATVCALRVPGRFGRGTSRAYIGLRPGVVSQNQPNVFIQRDFPDYNTTYSHIAHEMGHAMGLNHNESDRNSIMYPLITVGVKKGYDAATIVALASFYDVHVGP